MIDIDKETLIRLQDVRDYVPSSRKNKKLSKAVCFRWASKGCKGVILETVHVGGGRATSREALARFIQALSAVAGARTDGQRRQGRAGAGAPGTDNSSKHAKAAGDELHNKFGV